MNTWIATGRRPRNDQRTQEEKLDELVDSMIATLAEMRVPPTNDRLPFQQAKLRLVARQWLKRHSGCAFDEEELP